MRDLRQNGPRLQPGLVAGLTVMLALAGCGGSSGDSAADATTAASDPLATELQVALDGVSTDADFTLLAQAADGTRFVYSRGTSTPTTSYRSASTSKMVTAAVILLLVQGGVLALDDHPQNYLAFWPTTGNLAAIELRQLLSFTSGLTDEPTCLNNPLADFASCVDNILSANPTINTPGSEFYYASTHLQVAALMAVRASGLADWNAVFDYFKTRTGLFANAVYDLPSAQNPRVAGGMHWRATEYLAFLRALQRGEVLSPTLLGAMTSDQLGAATIGYSPVQTGPLGFDWHYGFGAWIECRALVFNCTTTTRVSSAGAYGAYPFIDFEQQYVGIVAREGALGTGHEGYAVWASVRDLLATWAAQHR